MAGAVARGDRPPQIQSIDLAPPNKTRYPIPTLGHSSQLLKKQLGLLTCQPPHHHPPPPQ